MTTEQLLAAAIAHHQAGRLGEAEQGYRRILGQKPRHPDALHLLGIVAHQVGHPQSAVDLVRQAIAVRPGAAEFHNTLGQILERLHRDGEAIDAYRAAITLRPDYPEAHNNLGNGLGRQLRFDEAVAALQRAIAARPAYAEAYNNLGNVRREQGHFQAAISAYEAALRLRPNDARIWLNLGVVLHGQRRTEEAVASFRQAAVLDPALAPAWNYLGVAYLDLGRFDESAAAFTSALTAQPGYAEAHNNLGRLYERMGRIDHARASFTEALRLQPNFPEAHNNLGVAYKASGAHDAAIDAFRAAIATRPHYAEAHSNLAATLLERGHLPEAIATCRRAIELDPNLAFAYANLGNALQHVGDPDGAIEACRVALEKDPQAAQPHVNWANALKDRGELDEAIAHYRQAIALQPDNAIFHSNLLLALHYHPAWDAGRLAQEHQAWRIRHADPLRAQRRAPGNDRTPGRRLRVGYVSADFREHAVARFLLPLLQRHDPAQFEIFCYDNGPVADATSQKFRALPHAWHRIVGRSDAEVAALVREHQIDILVDLAAHTAGNRLLVFARKPAPVQVTWLAYAGSTGLQTIDYRLTDPYLDPVGRDESVYSEQCVRLPETYWCCHAPEAAPPVNALPAATARGIAFGCLNNFCKVTLPVLECWTRVLQHMPDATLLLHALPGSHRERLVEWFSSRGIGRERVSFVGKQSPADYFATYHRIDVALDPFPFGGGTTTCDALWMGVPVVTQTGDTAVSRAGSSLLANVGLSRLVARNPEDYVRIAVELASDRPGLSVLRAGLRHRLASSPLMDAPRFAQDLETVYRTLWRTWCAHPSHDAE